MTSSEATDPKNVWFDEQRMFVELADGRQLGIPLVWFPRLLHATPEQRSAVWLSPGGLHWEEIDEDISVEGLIAGRGDMTRRPATPPEPNETGPPFRTARSVA